MHPELPQGRPRLLKKSPGGSESSDSRRSPPAVLVRQLESSTV